MDCKPTRLRCPWNSPGKNTAVSCHSLLQGISPTQGLNLGLLHCRQILYQLSHQKIPVGKGLARSPTIGEWPTQNADLGLGPPNPRPCPQATLCLMGIMCGPSLAGRGLQAAEGCPPLHSRPCHRRRQSRPRTGGGTGGPHRRGRQAVWKGSR